MDEFGDLGDALGWAAVTWAAYAQYATAFEMFRADHARVLHLRQLQRDDHVRRHAD